MISIKGRQADIQKHRIFIPEGLKLLLAIAPLILYVFAFSYVPLFGSVIAFSDYKPGMQFDQMQFVGFKNFIRIFSNSGDLLRVMRNTMVMSLLNIIGSIFPVVFAILLNEAKNGKFKRLVQTTTTLPNFISWIIVFGLSYGVFSSEGLLNSLLTSLGLKPIPSPGVLGNGDAVWVFQWLLGVWKGLGWGTIIYLASISGIDNDLYEAARVEGANRFQIALNVTLPGLYSTYLVLLLLSVSNILNNGFDQYFVFFNPLVANRIEVLDYYVYKVGILTGDYPLSTALGLTKSLISIMLLFTVNRLSKKLRGDSLV